MQLIFSGVEWNEMNWFPNRNLGVQLSLLRVSSCPSCVPGPHPLHTPHMTVSPEVAKYPWQESKSPLDENH